MHYVGTGYIMERQSEHVLARRLHNQSVLATQLLMAAVGAGTEEAYIVQVI
jgi:hypothetical protein